jgi:hypothetical protein
MSSPCSNIKDTGTIIQDEESSRKTPYSPEARKTRPQVFGPFETGF